MPIKPPVNCDNGTCRNQAVAGTRYCAACTEKRAGQPQPEAKKPFWAAWYHRWPWRGEHGLQRSTLVRDPICKMCNRAASTVGDHIKPHRGNHALFVDMANLQGLCKRCHDIKTATEDGGGGNPIKDPNAVVATGEPGRQGTVSSVGDDAIDRALAEEI